MSAPNTCNVCGDKLERGLCNWCFGDATIDQLRKLIQKLHRENEEQLKDLQSLREFYT